jgi:hypothetical protein
MQLASRWSTVTVAKAALAGAANAMDPATTRADAVPIAAMRPGSFFGIPSVNIFYSACSLCDLCH